MELTSLEQRGLAQILIYLLDHPGSQKVDYRKVLGIDSKNAMKVHDALWEKGYLEIVPNPRKLLFKLSPKGEYIAMLLKAVVQEDPERYILGERQEDGGVAYYLPIQNEKQKKGDQISKSL